MDQTLQRLKHDDEHRHLRKDRQTRSHWIDFVRLIQLHHRFVEFLSIAFELSLEASHLGLQFLHLEHAFCALECEWGDEQHHNHGHQTNRQGVVVGERIKLGD